MASMLKVQHKNLANSSNHGKRKRNELGENPVTENADRAMESLEPKRKRNKQRVLLLSSRGVTSRMRHLMNDIETILPHAKKGMEHCDIACEVMNQ